MKALDEMMLPFHKRIHLINLHTLKKSTILVTGATGLVGSNIIAYLSYVNRTHKLNMRIIGIYRSSLEKWMTNDKNIRYIKKDLSKNKLILREKIDFIIHAATYGQPKKFIAKPRETVELNIQTLFDLLELAVKHKSRFIYMSSAEIYGEADKKHFPTDESYYGSVNTLSERAIYAESKRLAETICYLYRDKIRVRIARLLICYGPGVRHDDQRVYSEFIKRAQSLGQITMMDEGKAERTLCFISDAVEMVLNILLSSKELVYNVSGKEVISIKKLAQLIAKINNAKVTSVINRNVITGTPNRSSISNNKYLREFRKRQFVPLSIGMSATSDWLKNIKPT